MIAKLVQKFDYVLEDKSGELDLALEFTLRPKNGTKCTLTVRE